jgi:perosamine synthetase
MITALAEHCESRGGTLEMNANPTPFLMPQDAVFSWGSLSARSEQDHLVNKDQSVIRWRFFWARNAIYHGLRALKISPGARILVPAYICKAAVEPIIAYGAKPVFYDVGRDCLPDIAAIESKLDPGAEALLVVHYFGFPQKIKLFRDFCDHHRLKLIEDCAHVLCGETDGQPLGTTGDFSVFSWRKFFPLHDGGELHLSFLPQSFEMTWQPESALLTLKVVKRILDQAVEEGHGSFLEPLWNSVAFADRARRRVFGSAAGPSQVSAVESRSASFDPALLNQPMSRPSRWLLAHSDHKEVIKKRRQNYSFLQSELSSFAGMTPLNPDLPPTVCPWVFPVFFDGLPNAHRNLRAKGIPAVAWEGVRPAGTGKEEFPSADFLYENLAFLPVHQSLSEDSLWRIVEVVKAFLGRRP